MSLTPAIREYLGAIYHLQQYEFGLQVPSVRLARYLAVSGPAVARMLKRLEQKELITYPHYGGFELTVEGVTEASKALRWHRILECFALDILGFEWEEVEVKAKQMLRGMDDSILEKMAVTLGDPKLSPYGEYIPPFDQLMPRCSDQCIQHFRIGSFGIVTRVRTTINDTMVRLTEMGAVPGASYEIKGRAPFNGPMRIKIDGEEQVLDCDLTLALWAVSEELKEVKANAFDLWMWQMSVQVRQNDERRKAKKIEADSLIT